MIVWVFLKPFEIKYQFIEKIELALDFALLITIIIRSN